MILVLILIFSSNIFARECTFSVKNEDQVLVHNQSFFWNKNGVVSFSFRKIVVSYERDQANLKEILSVVMPSGITLTNDEELDLIPKTVIDVTDSNRINVTLVCVKKLSPNFL